MAISSVVKEKIKRYLVEDGIIDIPMGIITIDDIITFHNNRVKIDVNYIPLVANKNISSKKIEEDLKEYFVKNINGIDDIEVSLVL